MVFRKKLLADYQKLILDSHVDACHIESTNIQTNYSVGLASAGILKPFVVGAGVVCAGKFQIHPVVIPHFAIYNNSLS
jgi:hypothetical protein